MHRLLTRLLPVVLLAFAVTSISDAQEVRVGGDATLKIGGRLQIQYNTTSVDSTGGSPLHSNEFLLRRARLTFDITFSDFIDARIEPDYSTIGGVGLFSLRDAYIRLTFGTGLRATVGQFKRPFDLFELTSSTQILVTERGGRIRGVRACGDFLTVCSLSNISTGLLYSDRDLGLMFDGQLVPGRLRYAVSATNGQTLGVREEDSGKQVTGRVSATALKDIVVSGNLAWKEYAHPLTSVADRATAWGADLEIGNFSKGLHIQAGIIGGDNWRQSTPDSSGIVSFLTGQVITTYRIPVANEWIDGIEPIARASWADPDRSAADDGGWLLTPGVILHLGSRNRLHINVDVWVPKTGETEYALLTQLNFYF